MQTFFSDGTKNVLVRPIYEKKNRQYKENYHRVSILNGFSKVYERFINDSMLLIIKISLSNFVSAYSKPYMNKSIENWKKNLNNIK